MNKAIDEQITKLEEAIRAQKSLRDSLGNEVVNATVEALREKLAGLRSSVAEERKLVTCLFCDLVGSTQMAAERDPEEVLQIIDGALREMSAAIQVYGGNVARYMGDGVLAFFGAPLALEDHAEQAILAGLDIQLRLAAYALDIKRRYELAQFQARVGINSGYVVAGHVAGAQGEYTVIGDTINVASRIESVAPPGGVLVGESTYRLAGGDTQFEAKALGEIPMKGQAEPLEVYQIQRRKDPIRSKTLAVARSPLTGRSSDLNELKRHFQDAVAHSQARVVAIVGDAGIGKTRIRHEFVDWLADSDPDALIWVGRGFSYTRQTPYALAGSLLRSALKISETDAVSQRREKLESGWVASKHLNTGHLHGLAAILALEYSDDSLSGLEPQAWRRAIFDAFSAFITSYARQGRLVLVFEYIHWSDDISIDSIEYLFHNASDTPLFGLMTTRPPDSSTGGAPTIASRIAVGPYAEIQLRHLTPGQTSEMIQSLLASNSVAENIIDSIVRAIQGNPFFIEEILSSLVEDGTLEAENGRWRLAGNEADIHVPDTVQGVLAARIDRLEPDLKSVLQHAAIIGRTFWPELLTSLMQESVDSYLNRLSELEFVQRRGREAVVQDWDWIFRHVLVQEVAYDGVLKQVRREVHRKIAVWLKAQGGDRLEELAPALAHHYEQGQVWDKAIVFLARADRGDQARSSLGRRPHADRPKEQELLVGMGMVYRRADDYENAMSHLSQALDVARSVDDRRGMADALYHLGSVAWSEGDNVRSTRYHEEALAICRELDLTDLVAAQAYHGRAEAYWFSGQPEKSIGMFTESLDLAREIGDKSYESENHQMLGMMHTGAFGVANYAKAEEHAAKSLAISEAAYLHWHAVPAMLTMVLVEMGTGQYQRAHEYALQANAHATEIGALRMLSIGLDYLGSLYQQLNLLEKAEAAHRQGVEVSLEIGTEFNRSALQAGLAIDRLRQGNLQVGTQLRKALSDAKVRDQLVWAARCLEGLAELSLANGDPQAAIDHAEELFTIAEAGGMKELVVKAHLWRGKAQIA